MHKKMRILAVTLFLLFGLASYVDAAQKLILYTSMKESLIGALCEAFTKKYPDVNINYQSAGAGRLMEKVAAERKAGKVLVDVLWTSDVPDFYTLKQEGMLEQYSPSVSTEIIDPFEDDDGYFTAVRLGTLGIVYNTELVKTPPEKWEDILGPGFKGSFGLANPAFSGTAYMSISLLVGEFGWEFVDKMATNKVNISRGAGQVIDDTVSGKLAGGIAVDYISLDAIRNGAAVGYVFPPEILVVPSPVAIIKNTPNLPAAKKFVDFLLSKEAQELIVKEGTLPVRNDVKLSPDLPVASLEEAVKRSIKTDYHQLMLEKRSVLEKFAETIQGNK